MTALIFIAILALLVLVHEFGHFIAAKKNGVKVEEFGFGFPPRIFGFKKGETLYSINLIPLGGFVKVHGEEYHEERKHIDKEKAFVYKKPWQKALIIIAGILGNFLLAWIIISFLLTQGIPVPTDKVTIEKVQSGAPAAKAGIKEKDIIVKVKKGKTQHEVQSTQRLIELSKKYADQEIILIVKRGGKEIAFNITPRKNPPKDQGPLGIAVTSFIEKSYPWYQAPFYGLLETLSITKKIIFEIGKVVSQLVTLKKPQVDVSGPIGIATFAGQAAKLGVNAVLELIALLSLNLAVINIFPFPALDGGRLVFVIYEWVTKRRVHVTIERYTNLIGIIILLILAAIVSVNDIIKLNR